MNPEYAARVITDIQSTAAVLPAVLSAIAAGDFDSAGSYFTEDVALEIRGVPEMNGCWKGRAEVVEAMRVNFGKVRDQRPVIESTVSSGETTAMLFREEGEYVADGSRYSVRVVTWLTFNGRQISRIEEIAAAA